ncbi:MAG: Ig-like domain-containing protein [Candidatus Kariarchaeaceae archaeon]|jgi:hypothetical protein
MEKSKYSLKISTTKFKISLLILLLVIIYIPQNSEGITSTTWETNTASTYSGTDQTLAVDGNGYLWMAEIDYASPYYYIRIYRSTNGGTSWSYMAYTRSTYGYYDLDMAIDIYTNRVYVVYEARDSTGDYDIYCFWYSSSSSLGITPISTGTENDRDPSIAVDFEYGASNYVFVSFERLITSDDRDAYIMRSTDDGISFSTWHTYGVDYTIPYPLPPFYLWVYDRNVYTHIDIAVGESANVYISYLWGADYSTAQAIHVAAGSRTSTAAAFEYSRLLWSSTSYTYPTTSIAVSRSASYQDHAVIAFTLYRPTTGDYDVYALTTNYAPSSTATWSLSCVACSSTMREIYPVVAPIGMGSSGNYIGDFFVAYGTYSASTSYRYVVKRAPYNSLGSWSTYHSSTDYAIYNHPKSVGITTIFKGHGGHGVMVAYRGTSGYSYVAGDGVTLVAPSLVSPVTNYYTGDSTPYLDWSDVPGTYRYHLQVARSTSFGAAYMDYESTSLSTSYRQLTTALSEGWHYWRVRSRDHDSYYGPWSGYRSIYVDLTPPPAPVLTAPGSGTFTTDTTPSLYWAAASTANYYNLEVRSGSSTGPVVYSASANMLARTITAQSNGLYYWHVRARDAYNNWGAWSSWRTFTIDTVAPVQPSLVSPAYDVTLTSSPFTLDWSTVADAYQYNIHLSTVSNFASYYNYYTSSGTPPSQITLSRPDAPLWYWRVRARDLAGNWGAYSAVWRFELDTTGPLSPTLVAPGNGALTNDNTPLMDWNPAGDAVKYYIQIDDTAALTSPIIDTSTTTSSYTPSTLSDGTYYWRVQAEDSVGNLGPWTSIWSFTIDATPPGAPVLTSPIAGSTSNNQNPNLVWNAVSGASEYQVQLDNTTSFVSPLIDEIQSATTHSVVNPLAGDTYYWRVRAKDTAGNWGSWGSILSFTVDITDPIAPLLSSPNNGEATSNTGPQLQWQSVGDAVEYQVMVDNNVDFSSTLYDTTTTGTSLATSTLTDDLYYWKVRAKDAAGNWGEWSSTWTFVVDTTGPIVPYLNYPLDIAISNSNPELTWNEIADADTYNVQVDDDSGFISPIIDTSTSSTSHTTSTLIDGIYYWRVRAQDAVGNWGAWNATGNFTIDTTPPGATTLSSPANSASLTITPLLEWNPVTDAAEYQWQVDTNSSFSTPLQNYTSSTSYVIPELDDGTYNWRVRARDAVGNWGPWSSVRTFIIDKAGPDAPLLTAPAAGSYLGSTPQLEWGSVSDATLYQVQVDNNPDFSSPEVDTQPSGTIYTPSSLGDGDHYWRVRGRDAALNWGDWSLPGIFTIDTIDPVEPILLSPTGGDTIFTLDTDFTWEEDLDAVEFRIQISGSPIFATLITDDTSTTNTYTTSLPVDTTYYWRVQAKDAAGNWGAWNATGEFGINSAPATLDTPIDMALVTIQPTLVWNEFTDAVEYQLQVDGSPTFVSPEIFENQTDTSYVTSGLTDGSYYWRVRARDGSGNWGTWSSVWVFTIDTALPDKPVLVTPTDGQLVNAIPELTWNDISDASEYQVQIDDSNDFSSPAADITQAGSAYTTTASLTDGVYYWRVRAKDVSGNWGEWSEIRSFTLDSTAVIPPAVPTLQSPTNGAVTNDGTITVSWSTDVNSVDYHVQVSSDSSFATTIANVTTAITSHVINPLTDGSHDGTYYWRVRGINSEGTISGWSAVWTYTLDTQAPNVPSLKSPADSSVIDASVVLEWIGLLDASSYTIQISSSDTFSTLKVDQSVSTTSYSPTGLDVAIYYWRVRAVDAAGNVGAWSVVWSFALSEEISSQPTTEPTTTPVETTPVDTTSSSDAPSPDAGLPAPNILLVLASLLSVIAIIRRRRKY